MKLKNPEMVVVVVKTAMFVVMVGVFAGMVGAKTAKSVVMVVVAHQRTA